jgi:hypothetical protein
LTPQKKGLDFAIAKPPLKRNIHVPFGEPVATLVVSGGRTGSISSLTQRNSNTDWLETELKVALGKSRRI